MGDMSEVIHVHLQTEEVYREAVERSLTYRDIANKALYELFLELTPPHGQYVAAEVPVTINQLTPIKDAPGTVFCRVDFFTQDMEYRGAERAMFSGTALTLTRPLDLLEPHSGRMQAGVVAGDSYNFDALLQRSESVDVPVLVQSGGGSEG